MMRLIDADKLKKEVFDDYSKNDMFYPEYHVEACKIFTNIIDSQPTFGHWISVKDQLPPNDDKKVLTYGNPVSHWMPLPEPPKEDNL